VDKHNFMETPFYTRICRRITTSS